MPHSPKLGVPTPFEHLLNIINCQKWGETPFQNKFLRDFKDNSKIYYSLQATTSHVGILIEFFVLGCCRQFNDIMNVMFSSSAIVVILIAVTLDNTLKAPRKDRGLLWWDKFKTFGSDPRNLEFYKLPMGLNKFFPPT
jgi:hypothetical protein